MAALRLSLAETTNRIDQRLGAEVIDHLSVYLSAILTVVLWVSLDLESLN